MKRAQHNKFVVHIKCVQGEWIICHFYSNKVLFEQWSAFLFIHDVYQLHLLFILLFEFSMESIFLNLSVDSVIRIKQWRVLSHASHSSERGRHPGHDHPGGLYRGNLSPRPQHRSHLLFRQKEKEEIGCVTFRHACNHEESNHVALFKTMRSVYVYYQQISVAKPDYNLPSKISSQI